MLWHFTDQFYHTDNDRLDKVSRETLRNVSTGALASAIMLLNADEQFALRVVEEVKSEAISRINIEKELTKKALENNTAVEDEQDIVPTWVDYYEKSLKTISTLPLGGSTDLLDEKIRNAQEELRNCCQDEVP